MHFFLLRKRTMSKFNIVENWLSTVGYSHSNSVQTRAMYQVNLQKFLDFTEKTPEQIVKQYERTSDRKFKRLYAQYLMSLIRELQKKGYSPSTISSTVNTIRSFFKYNDLPLGFIPSGSNLIEFHNRDIARTEVLEILRLANVRDRAFFCMMAQSGLRPSTIANLKTKDIEGILEENTPIPCKITVRQENTKGKYAEYFSFMGQESVSYLKDYLKTKNRKLTPEDYVFTKFEEETEEKPLNPAILTHMFERIVKRLRKKNILNFNISTKQMSVETKNHEPLRDHISRSELRLYNLRKFFRKYAGHVGADYVNYWMGHTSALGVDLHYFSKDAEFHRKLYREKALPFLRLEVATSSDPENQIEELRNQVSQKDEEVKNLKDRIERVEPFLVYVEDLQRNPDKSLEFFVRSWLREYEKGLTQEEGNAGAALTEELSKKLAQALVKSLNMEFPKKRQKSELRTQ
jgi:integrase